MAIDQSNFNKSRLDKFLLVLNLPPVLNSISTNDLAGRGNNSLIGDSLQFSVYGSVIPEIVVPEESLGYGGQSYKVSTNNRPVYENVSVNFTVDNNFNNYWVIYKWLDFLNDEKLSQFNGKDLAVTPNVSPKELKQNKTLVPPTLYQTDLTIFGMDEFDKPRIKFTYTKAFPVSLGSINYNYRNAGEIETNFDFAFSQLLVDLV
jgi:hypothetical protein